MYQISMNFFLLLRMSHIQFSSIQTFPSSNINAEFCHPHPHLQVTAVLTEEHLLHFRIVTYVAVGREGKIFDS